MMTRARSASSETTPVAEESLSYSDSVPLVDEVPKKKKKRRGRGFTSSRADRWVCIMPESCDGACDGAATESIVSLRDPSTKCPKKYLFRETTTSKCDYGEICEILKFSDEPRSWFIGNSIQTDGSLFLCTPVDPLFMALPYFQEAAKNGKFTTLDVILEDSTHDSYRILSSCIPADQWQNISQQKSVGSDTMVYKYSKEKTLDWLKKKIAALTERLQEEKIYVGQGSRSSMFVESKKQSEVTKDHFTSYSCGIICDYLTEELSREISSVYPVPTNEKSERASYKVESQREKDSDEDLPAAKRIHSGPLEDYSGIMAEPTKDSLKLTSAQRTLAKIDKTGMKSLSNFFKNK